MAIKEVPQRFVTLPREPHPDLVISWLKLYDFLHAKDFDSDKAKQRSAQLRRDEVLRQLKKQVELAMTRWRFDELALIEHQRLIGNGTQEIGGPLSEKSIADLRQKTASTLNDLQRDAQKAALELNLDGSVAGDKTQTVVSTYPMKYVESAKAQATIMDITKLFGLALEMPASDVKTNMLIFQHHGQEKYFKCLARIMDGSASETDLSTDQQMELWKLRIRFLAMLERMVETGVDPPSVVLTIEIMEPGGFQSTERTSTAMTSEPAV